jgi:hypothetical protein
LVKISKRVTVVVAVITVIGFIIFLDALIFFPDAFKPPQSDSKLQVSNLQIIPSSDWHSSSITLTVTNTYNSPVTVIGSRANGVNFGYLKIEIPPGQSQEATLPLHNLVINNSTSYKTELVFTFEDGKYEVYSQSITPKKYAGSFIITGQSINGTSNSTKYSVTIQNTGNIPLVSAKCTIGIHEVSLPMQQNLMPKSSATFEAVIPFSFNKGTPFYVVLEAKFADGSTQSGTSSYQMQ